MKYNSVELTKSVESILEVEILFTVASARAEGNSFSRLILPVENNEKILANSIKILKNAKKQGRIQLYILNKDIAGDSTEAEYLKNKYPDITDIVGEAPFLLVKI